MPSGEEEVRSQRHDFIKEYYKMATLDLDRHLKGGWQAIAILAGGAAVLTAGHEGKIGLPIASALALATATWAALTCIDANFWSLRAIAFLSNVEAIYFSADDRKYFNPYIGRHPQFKLLNSLKYIFWLSLFFGAATLLNLLWEMSKRYPRPGMIIEKIRTMGAMQFALWGFPELVAAWGILLILIVSRNLLGQYIQFTTESPGPGVRTNARELRHVRFCRLERRRHGRAAGRPLRGNARTYMVASSIFCRVSTG